ncbi:MAG: septum formation inhibitor Maf [Lachnospiraceae bacterium]|nr:septum formation inhibitor Maf [Lachnospiraceae bacterium]
MQGKEGIRVMKVILASGSPRRKELMEKAGLEFEVIPAECEEVIDPALTAEETVMSLASRKASWVAENEKDKRRDKTIVIGADTVVVLDGKILGKPKDKADAFSMLRALSGREHEVYTGVALISPDGKINETFSECTKVKFRSLSDQEIEEYIATDEPNDKAGAYGIQGLGRRLVEETIGDYNNVVGLPVEALMKRIAGIKDEQYKE